MNDISFNVTWHKNLGDVEDTKTGVSINVSPASGPYTQVRKFGPGRTFQNGHFTAAQKIPFPEIIKEIHFKFIRNDTYRNQNILIGFGDGSFNINDPGHANVSTPTNLRVGLWYRDNFDNFRDQSKLGLHVSDGTGETKMYNLYTTRPKNVWRTDQYTINLPDGSVDSNVKWKIQFDPPNYTNKRPVTFWNDWDGTGWKKVAWEGGIGGASKNTRYFDPSIDNYLMGCCEYDGDGIKDAKYVYPPIDSIQWGTIWHDDPPQGSIEVCKRLEVDYDISGEYPITLKNLNTSNNLYQEYEIDCSGGLQDFLKKKLTSISGESIWPITDWNAGKYQEVLMNNFKMVFDNSVYSFYKLPTTNTSTHTTLYTYISKTPELVSGTYNFTWFLKKQKQYVRDIIFNDISLNNINAEYVPRGKVNKVKIILNKPFQSTDVIKISMDSGFTWINMSEMFGYNDIDGVWDCTSKLTESSRI